MVALLFVSVVAHFFVVVSGSKIHERAAHFFTDIYTGGALHRKKVPDTMS